MELGIGTAQFGLDYGITNTKGMVSAAEQKEVIETLVQAGLRYIDTAPGYGSAEDSLGKYINSKPENFRVVTKASFSNAQSSLQDSIIASTEKLKCKQVYGFLIHDYFKLSESELVKLSEELAVIKRLGLSVKVGASLYEPRELETFLKFNVGDLIQIPVNPLDWRFADSKLLELAKGKGVEIHARSLFLQGSLLTEKNSLPPHLAELQPALSKFINWSAEQKLTALKACWAFAKSQKAIDVVFVGVEGTKQFAENVAAYKQDTIRYGAATFRAFKSDSLLVDPRNWKPKLS